jgi:quercetin dioxygenase-like cupin family protein
MAGMVTMTRIYADADGCARFEDVPIAFTPPDPAPDVMAVSAPVPAAAVVFGLGPAGGSHPEQPEHRRQLIVGMTGRVEITATGETRTFGPGDVLLVEDTTGTGHSSRSGPGFTAAVVVLA